MLHRNKRPTVQHDNFKLWVKGREFIYIVGIYANKICEQYDIFKNEWDLLPSIPKESLSTCWFVEDDRYLWCMITPFEINEKTKRIYYTLDTLNPEKWVDATESKFPLDFNAKFPLTMQYPAKIVHDTFYYFLDSTGTIVIQAQLKAMPGTKKSEWYAYLYKI